MNSFRQNGYVVFENVFSVQECRDLRSALDEPQATHAHGDFMWTIRCDERVQRVFATLWECRTDELISSFDGACVQRSNECSRGLPWHLDQNSLHDDGLMSVQGILLLTDMDEKRGGTAFVRKSHLKHVKVLKRHHREDEREDEWDFVLIEDDDPVLRNTHNIVQPNVSAGSILLWDSRTVHRVVPPTDISTERAVVYLSMAPRKRLKDNVAKLRQNAYKKGIATTHWCTKFVDRGEKRCPPTVSYAKASESVRVLIS